MSQVLDDSAAQGRDAAARGAWQEAYDLLAPAARTLTGEDLEALANAAFWTGKLDEAIEFREQAHAAFVAGGDKPHAAMLAVIISRDYLMKMDFALSHGWFAKAQRLLEGEDESEAHGYLAISQAFDAMFTGDLDTSDQHATRAQEIGARFGDRNLEAMARVTSGRIHVLRGDVDEGLALLDEATAAAISGELEPWTTGFIYCCTITSSSGVGDYRRAAEWTAAANRWCDRSQIKGFPGACRVHRASIMRLQGDWPTAEEQATQRRRPTGRRRSGAAIPSPGLRFCVSPRERPSPLQPRSSEPSSTPKIRSRRFGAFRLRSRSRWPWESSGMHGRRPRSSTSWWMASRSAMSAVRPTRG
jgi:tetratricopeptide (TPR) repeat protein